MKIEILPDYETMSAAAAEELLKIIKQKPNTSLCFAAGETPKRTCELFVKQILEEKIDVSKCTFFGLDEWVGIEPTNEGSCAYFLHHHLFKPLALRPDQYYFFDFDPSKTSIECQRIDAEIEKVGGLDVILVGIGLNAHIGFNEPGVPFENYCHVIELDESTKTVGQKYFNSQTALSQGITVGLQHLLDAQKAILIANGDKKAEIIAAVVQDEISPALPATTMRLHKNSLVLLDILAAKKLTVV